MAKKDKIRLPSSQGGLVSYGDSVDAFIQIKPTTVMGYVITITILAILVRLI